MSDFETQAEVSAYYQGMHDGAGEYQRELTTRKAICEAIRGLHTPYGGAPLAVEDKCNHDGHDWPCPTVRIIDKFVGGAS